MYAFLIILDNGILSLLCNETFSFFWAQKGAICVIIHIGIGTYLNSSKPVYLQHIWHSG